MVGLVDANQSSSMLHDWRVNPGIKKLVNKDPSLLKISSHIIIIISFFWYGIHGTKSINLRSNVREWYFDRFLHFEIPWIRKSHFQHFLCVSVINITQKQITVESSNLAFYIFIIGRCYLKRFIKIGQKPCVQEHTKEF